MLERVADLQRIQRADKRRNVKDISPNQIEPIDVNWIQRISEQTDFHRRSGGQEPQQMRRAEYRQHQKNRRLRASP